MVIVDLFVMKKGVHFLNFFFFFFSGGGGDGGIDVLLFSSGNVDKLDLFFVLSLKGPMCHYTF